MSGRVVACIWPTSVASGIWEPLRCIRWKAMGPRVVRAANRPYARMAWLCRVLMAGEVG